MWNQARGRELKKRACCVNRSREGARPEGRQKESRPKTSPPHRRTAGTGSQPPVVLRYTGRGGRVVSVRSLASRRLTKHFRPHVSAPFAFLCPESRYLCARRA